MVVLVLIVLAVIGLGFGLWGWRRGTWYVVNLPGRVQDQPVGVPRDEWERTLARRYRWLRLLLTVGGAAGVPAVAFLVLMVLVLRS